MVALVMEDVVCLIRVFVTEDGLVMIALKGFAFSTFRMLTHLKVI